MTIDVKKIVVGLAATGIIVAGLVIDFKTSEEDKTKTPNPNLLTYDEYAALLEIYDKEIKLGGGKMTMSQADKNSLIPKMNSEVLKRINKTPQTVSKTELTSDDYNILRSGLMKKAELK